MKEMNSIIKTMNNVISNMPKTELHLHIEGSLEPELMLKLAQKNNINIPFSSIEEIKKAYKFNNLQEFLDIYYQGASVLITESDFYDLTFAYLKKAHEQNIVHTEFFLDPQTRTERGISFDSIFNGIYSATIDAEKEYGITSLIIMSFLRHLSEEDAFETLRLSYPFKDKIIGIGLDSSELGNPPEKFERVYKKAKKLGFKLVAHAGEEGPVDYIWSALKLLEIDRIDHGNTSLNDKNLVNYLVKNKIALTICPLSNLELKVCTDLTKHPIKQMIELGMIVTVNSDDPAYFGGYVNENYIQITKKLNLSIDDLKTLAKNSFRASFLDEKNKNIWLNKIDDYFNSTN